MTETPAPLSRDAEFLKTVPLELVTRLLENVVSTVANSSEFGFDDDQGNTVLFQFESFRIVNPQIVEFRVSLVKGIAKRELKVSIGVSE